MAQDHVGVYDTPPASTEYRVAVAIIACVVIGLMVVLPFRELSAGESPAVVAAIRSMMLVCELITATLLLAQAALFRSRSLVVLATGYIFGALLVVPHTLTLPGAFSDDGLLGGGVNTTAWLGAARRLAFPLAVIAYVLIDEWQSRAFQGIRRSNLKVTSLGLGIGIVLAASVTALTTLGHDFLPALFIDRTAVVPIAFSALTSAEIAVTIAGLTLLARRQMSLLDLWLSVALVSWLLQLALLATLPARYSAGFYTLNVMMFVSSLTVMIALVADSYQLYQKLVLSTVAHEHEREDRLISMDVLATVMSHEAGQPLSAAMLNMNAAENWLSRPKPNIKKAIDSLQLATEAGQRTFAVIKSIRSATGGSLGTPSEFSLKALVEETVHLMRDDVHRKKASVRLDLDRDPLPVRGDPVQMQRVLVNLLMNALEALDKPSRTDRHILVSSRNSTEQDILLEIADTGQGIAAGDHERIFEPFVTTKKSGSGLGLWLCRTVVEHHEGRLWATGNTGEGATFHLHLPSNARKQASHWRELEVFISWPGETTQLRGAAGPLLHAPQ